LPAKFRADFEHGGLLSPNDDGCAALWTPAEFRRQLDEKLSLSRGGGSDGRQLARFWAANSSEVEFDKQGRFAVPPAVRDFAQLSGDVLIVGALDHVELWNPAAYEEKVGAAADQYKQGND
jgi:MraZ protein